MMTTMEEPHYSGTLIAIADDCPVKKSVVPVEKGGKATVATIQYEMLADHPYEYVQPDVLFTSWLARQETAEKPSKAAVAKLRADFFSKPQPCLRASPLPKKYGFGLLFDEQGRVALCPMESDEYRRLAGAKQSSVKVLKAFRTSRG
jgi:hypothetical protein